MPGSGRFRIVSVRAGIPPIGADIYDEGAMKPVISAGSSNVWILEELSESEKYRVTLDSNFAWFSRQDGNDVVVDSSPSTQVWSIRWHGDGKYTIERDTPVWPNLGWTLSGEAPKSPVVLRVVELPTEAQLWRFIKLAD
ncbi:hypothetical protein BDN67DRAFT_1009454 [Paxillus ammoniavirescens]|nr:hypothetical protein BDN67DRAFT_1009454 [Paxillus ammoniavirescens]